MCTETKLNTSSSASNTAARDQPSPASVAVAAAAAQYSESSSKAAFNNNEDGTHDFRYVGTSCPHAARRREILEKYPQIRDLFGPDRRLILWSVFLVAVQVYLAAKAAGMSWPVFFLTAYAVGGTASHALSLAGHELSHSLAFHKPLYNELLAIFCNMGQGVASGITFKRYHMEHHLYQGSDLDTDIPSNFEASLIPHNSVIGKLLWILMQPWCYAFRPLIVNPKPMTKMELLNNLVVYGWDLFLVHKFGFATFGYFLTSIWCGMSFHPVAGHFISEHYTMNPDSLQETYSYYGPLNRVCFNVGYHNEHHDFPRISGFNLPKVRAIAPEYYDERWTIANPDGVTSTPMAYHTSWTKVLVDYVLNPRVGPYSRVKRIPKETDATTKAAKATKAE